MKAKELQRNSDKFGIGLARVLPLLLLLLMCLPLSVFAESEYIVENHNLIESRLGDIGKEISSYNSLDSTPTKAVATKVTDLINSYRQELLDLQSHTDVAKRSLKSEIDRAYAKSRGAGRLGWIYYYNSSLLADEAAQERFGEAFTSALGRLEDNISAESLTHLTDDLCTALNRFAYTERIRQLEAEGDSATTLGYIELAVLKLENISSPDHFGESFALVFEETGRLLSLQRTRDGLYSQVEDIYSIIFPDSSVTADKNVALFNIKLKDATSISLMNEAARELLCLLSACESTKGYARDFADKLHIAIADRALKGSGTDSAADFITLFENYPLELKKAEAKDKINTILAPAKDKELLAIEALFNGKDGLVDCCATAQQIDTEVLRAEYRKKLYTALSETLADLGVIMGSYPQDAFAKRANDAYFTASTSVNSLASTSKIFDENCKKALEKLTNELEKLLVDAKAERFLLDNKPIITKPREELSKSDEAALKIAFTDYMRLEPDVCAVLSGQVNSIVEKYKIVLSLKIQEAGNNDVFYLDLCETIIQEIKNLPSNNIAEFYNKCELVLKKSQTLSNTLAYYREICASTLYSSYLADEKAGLSAICKTASAELADIDISAKSFEELLDNVLNNTITSLDRADQTVRVRVALRGSENVNIQKLYSDARAAIHACSGRAEMIALADKAIFKINRLLTVDAVISHSDLAVHSIGAMKFLTSEKRAVYASAIESIKRSFADQVTVCENITVLSFLWNSFCEELTALEEEAGFLDLSAACEHYTALIKKDTDALTESISALAHLSAVRKEELISSLTSVGAKFIAAMQTHESSQAVSDAYALTLEQLSSLELSAESENLKNYRSVISERLDSLAPPKEKYSAKSYERILAVIADAKKSLESCVTLTQCNSLLENTKKDIALVPDLLGDARTEALSALKEALALCTDNSSLYSSESLETALRLYANAEALITSFKNISEIPTLKSATQKAVEDICALRRNLVYSSPSASKIDSDSPVYPLGYDFGEGYWGKLYSKNGIPSNSLLSVLKIDNERELGRIESLIRSAVKRGEYPSFDKNQLKLLKHSVVALGLDISLSGSDPSVNSYNLRLLLPEYMKEENILALAFVGENGSVELYSLARKGSLISVDLSHFSAFYVLCEETVDLTPLIIFLIILLVFEIIVLCFILFLRYNRRRKEENMLPESFLYGVNPALAYFALRVKPTGAVELTVLLSVAALALGCGIALLARAELPFLKKQSSLFSRKRKTDAPTVTAKEESLLPKKETPQLLSQPESIPVLCGAPEEAYEEDVVAFTLSDDIPQLPQEPHEAPSGVVRAEVNLDAIAKKFNSGELVTVAELKKKRLIPRKAEYVKILARGVLTKPLIIEAHDFSRAAEEMLTAIGGEAVRVQN